MECPGSPPRVLFECDFCEGVFHTVRALRAHRYKVHGIESNAEVMVDIEHVACQMDAVNAYVEPDLTSEITVDWDECETPKKFKHRVKQQRHKHLHSPLAAGKQKNKITKKRQKAIIKKRRISLNNMPACFQAAQVNGKQLADSEEPIKIDILKSIYGDVDPCDSDQSGNDCSASAKRDNSGKGTDSRERNGIIRHLDSHSDSCPSSSEPCDLPLSSKLSRSPSREATGSPLQDPDCPRISLVRTFHESHGKRHGKFVGNHVSHKAEDNKSKETKREDLFTVDSSFSQVQKQKHDKISKDTSHDDGICPEGELDKAHQSVRQRSQDETHGKLPFAGVGQPTPAAMGKPREKVKPRTRTKARLKKNLHRAPGKRKLQRDCSLQPFSLKPAPASDSPPHLSPITSLPAPSLDTPRVPKVRLKRQNSTEFKAYFIPCSGARSDEDDDGIDGQEDDDDDDDDRPMPDLERQEDLMPVLMDDVSETSDNSRPPPELVESNDVFQMSAANLGSMTSESKLMLEEPESPQSQTTTATKDIAEVRDTFDKMNTSSGRREEQNTENEFAADKTENPTRADIKQEELDDKHVEAESGKRFICQFCGKVYKWLIHFRVHESKHAAGKLFHCRTCGFSAVDKKDVVQHCEKLEHRMAGTASPLKGKQCTWLGDQEAIQIPPELPRPVTKKPSPPCLQKKHKQSKQGCRKVKESPVKEHQTDRKACVDRNKTKVSKAVRSLDRLIESFTCASNQKASKGCELLQSSQELSSYNGIMSTDVKPLAAELENISRTGLVTNDKPNPHDIQFPAFDLKAVKVEPLSETDETATSGVGNSEMYDHQMAYISDVKTETSPTFGDVCSTNSQASENMPTGGVVDELNSEWQEPKPGLLGKRKKKKYNKLFNHRTRRGCKKARLMKTADVKQEANSQPAEMERQQVGVLNFSDITGCAKVKCETTTAVPAEEGVTKKRKVKRGAALKKGNRERKNTLRSRARSAKLDKCLRIKTTFLGQPRKGTVHQKQCRGSGKVKNRRTLTKKASTKSTAKLSRVENNPRNGKKKASVVAPKKSGWKKKYHQRNVASKGLQKSSERASDGQAVSKCEFSENRLLTEQCTNNVRPTEVQLANNSQFEQNVKEPKQNNLLSFGRSPSSEIAVDGSVAVSHHLCQKGFETSACSESPERRRPGLVHRRHLVLDDDADDDVGYHSSGSLDQVSHDESHDPAAGRGSQSAQCRELGRFWKGTKEGHRTVCCHIRRLVTNLFEDQPGSSCQQAGVGKSSNLDLDVVKTETTSNESAGLTTSSSKMRSFLDSLLPTTDTSRESTSDVDTFKPVLNIKQEPDSRSEATGINALNAITDFAAKLSKFKFRVKPEPLKGSRSELAIDASIKVELPEVGGVEDSNQNAAGSSTMISRCDSGVYVESPTDGLPSSRHVAEGISGKPIKAEALAECAQTKPESRSLWDCILPDLLGGVGKSRADGASEDGTQFLTQIRTEGSGQHKKHYIYCPACRSQVIIKTEPPPAGGSRLHGVVGQGLSASSSCQESPLRNVASAEGNDTGDVSSRTNKCCSLGPDRSHFSCSLNCQSLSSDPLKCGHRVLSFVHCYHCVETDVLTSHRLMRLVKHKHQIPALCCDTATLLEGIKTRHRILKAPQQWHHSVSSSMVHSHTDDCIYNGCQQY